MKAVVSPEAVTGAAETASGEEETGAAAAEVAEKAALTA